MYEDLTLKVPMEFSRLDTLENLLSTSGDGLQFTNKITITTQQAPLRAGQLVQSGAGHGNVEQPTSSETVHHLPKQAISDSLNTLIRFLILKVPRDHLTSFRLV